MKDSLYETALTGINEWVDKVSTSIAHDFKNVKPFDKKQVTNAQLAKHYANLSPMEREAFISQYGQTAIDFFNEMDRHILGV